jgi:hypothetical protein
MVVSWTAMVEVPRWQLVAWWQVHGGSWWHGGRSTVAVGGMVASDMGARGDSGIANTINHCRMGENWFFPEAFSHEKPLKLYHIAWEKPLSQSKGLLILVRDWDATWTFCHRSRRISIIGSSRCASLCVPR